MWCWRRLLNPNPNPSPDWRRCRWCVGGSSRESMPVGGLSEGEAQLHKVISPNLDSDPNPDSKVNSFIESPQRGDVMFRNNDVTKVSQP